MIYDKPNRYDCDEILFFNTERGPDGTYYPVTYEVIGQRRKINGQAVDERGIPLPPNDVHWRR